MIKNAFKFIFSIFICQAAGGVGSIFTINSLTSWYFGIKKPFFTPPDWVFAPVWTTLFLLMGISLFLVWKSNAKKEDVRAALFIFFTQLFLNSLWSAVFFGARSIAGALPVIFALLFCIAWTIKRFLKISRLAAYLLIPYLAWVSFAALLNIGLARLN